MKRSPVPKQNRARLKKRRAECFGEKAEWIRKMPCVMRLHQGCSSRVEAIHVRSRGAGGKAESLLPMCNYHHGQLHVMGRRTFEAFHVRDLGRAAEKYERLWRQQGDVADQAKAPQGDNTPPQHTPALTGDL